MIRLAKTDMVYRPNLLINGDFQVWPRGESFTIQSSQTNKTAAMWQLQNQRETAAQIFHQTTDEGKGTGFGFPGLSSMRIYQWLPIEVMKPYEGKKMTRIWSVNKQVSKEEFTLDLTENINGGYWRAFYYLSSSNDVLNFAGLYEGSVGTHFIEDEATALMKSQEWVYRIPNALIGYGGGSGNLWFSVPHLLNMKGVPSISTSSSANIVCEGRITSVSNITLQFNSTYKTLQSSDYEGQNNFISKVVGLYFAEDIIFSCEP